MRLHAGEGSADVEAPCVSPARRPFAVILVVLSALALPASASEEEPRPPGDYTQVEGLSQPEHQTRRDVYRVPMDDGIQMYVEVVRPVLDGRYPVILELSPYHGTAEDRSGTHILPWPEAGGEPLGLAGYFAPRGYSVAFADLRGTGRSQGCLDYLGPKDRADAYDIVEWLGSQPWSSGRVGMTGHSYDAMAAIMTAAVAPPHLATIAPSAGAPRMYDHLFQDGVPYLGTWTGAAAAYELIAWQRHLPPTPVEISIFGASGDNFGNDMQYAGCGATQTAGTTGASYLTGAETDWHRARDHSDGFRVADIPVFHVQATHDAATRTSTMPPFTARDNPEDKLWFGQWHHGSTDFPYPNDRFAQWTGALHAWFDRHLQQRDVDTGPPVEMFLNGAGKVVTAEEWPLPETSSLTLYPTAGGSLAASPGPAGTLGYDASPAAWFYGAPPVPSSEPDRLSFVSTPMARDTLIAGSPTLRLRLSITSPRVDIMATLWDLDPAGEDAEKIGQAVFAMNPELRAGIDRPQPVTPGQEMVLDMKGMDQAHLLEAGRYLALTVASADIDKTPVFAQGARVTLSLGGAQPAALTLPVVEEPLLWDDPLGP